MTGLAALRRADFDWVMRLDEVWRDAAYDVPALNAPLRDAVIRKCKEIGASPDPASPLGWVILGPAGAGKTHLLAGLRRASTAAGAAFILVDMTDVRDFWETMLLGFLNSLREPEEAPQCRRIIRDLLEKMNLPPEKAEHTAHLLARQSAKGLIDNTNKLIKVIARTQKRQAVEHQDVVRALLLLNSDDFILGSLGYSWLMGQNLEPEETRRAGLRRSGQTPLNILKGLSWLLSLRGPTILALDQMDAIVSEQRVASGAGHGGAPTEETARRPGHHRKPGPGTDRSAGPHPTHPLPDLLPGIHLGHPAADHSPFVHRPVRSAQNALAPDRPGRGGRPGRPAPGPRL